MEKKRMKMAAIAVLVVVAIFVVIWLYKHTDSRYLMTLSDRFSSLAGVINSFPDENGEVQSISWLLINLLSAIMVIIKSNVQKRKLIST